MVLIDEPSMPTRIDLMCFSPTIFPLIVFRLSIINFGSGLPEPNVFHGSVSLISFEDQM
jgi:hypothetical protein